MKYMMLLRMNESLRQYSCKTAFGRVHVLYGSNQISFNSTNEMLCWCVIPLILVILFDNNNGINDISDCRDDIFFNHKK